MNPGTLIPYHLFGNPNHIKTGAETAGVVAKENPTENTGVVAKENPTENTGVVANAKVTNPIVESFKKEMTSMVYGPGNPMPPSGCGRSLNIGGASSGSTSSSSSFATC